MSLPTVLLAGFEPFGGADRNPSGELAKEIAESSALDAQIRSVVLPVEFRVAGKRVQELVAQERPDIALLTGLAAGSSSLAVERVAVNYFSAGAVRDEKVLEGAPDAYFSPFPVTELVEALNAEGIPARASLSAGSYCCNEALFLAIHTASSLGLSARAGFVHLPYFPEQPEARDSASMPRALQRRGIESILARLLRVG